MSTGKEGKTNIIKGESGTKSKGSTKGSAKETKGSKGSKTEIKVKEVTKESKEETKDPAKGESKKETKDVKFSDSTKKAEPDVEIEIILNDETPEWDKLSLLEYLEEGNVPHGYEEFFGNGLKELETISDFLEKSKSQVIIPRMENVFATLYSLRPEEVKCVILGQDPYHSINKDGSFNATGFCFDVHAPKGEKLNPSLKNIYNELDNCGHKRERDGNFNSLSKQGVLLLNVGLSVFKGSPQSNLSQWEKFSGDLIKYINGKKKRIVWILMGGYAIGYRSVIMDSGGETVCCSHPSPLGYQSMCSGFPAFSGSKIFDLANEVFRERKEEEIDWSK